MVHCVQHIQLFSECYTLLSVRVVSIPKPIIFVDIATMLLHPPVVYCQQRARVCVCVVNKFVTLQTSTY